MFQVLGFPGTYVFYKYGHSKQRRTPSQLHTDGLNKDRRVSLKYILLAPGALVHGSGYYTWLCLGKMALDANLKSRYVTWTIEVIY